MPIKPEIAKTHNLPIKLPVLVEDLPLITEIDKIPLEVIIRGLEAQYEIEKNDYWGSYLAYFYYEAFKKHLNKNQLEKAKEYLEKAKNTMYDYRYHFYLGLLFSKLSDYDNAEIELKRAISLNPNFYLGYYELGNILYLKKDYDEAIEMYMKSLELNKEFSLPLLKIGDVYFENNQLKDAELAYKAALKIEKLPEVYLRLGVLYNTRYQFENAEKVFKEALSIEYKPEIAYNLSYTLTRLGKHLQALQLLKELVNNYPSSEVYNELGLLQKNLGFYEEAKENLKLAGDEYRENYLKVQLFIEGIKEEILKELKEYDPEYTEFLKNVLRNKDNIEKKLEECDFPFSELEIIFDLTDENGEILLDKFMETLKIKNIGEKKNEFYKFIPFIISGMYIAGADPILIEKNAIKISITLFGDGEGVVLAKTLTTFYLSILFTNDPIEFIIEKTLEIISEFHYPISKKIADLLENEKTSLDDFIDNFKEPENILDFLLQLFEFFSYSPHIEDTKHLPNTTFRKTAEFFTKHLNF
ncbi:tetratricopeptide repeat protein [Thermosipho atlanticus]|uniref:Tfp pilus assembly protein PilF n=1 Tax=Thermosipho atlanticus DSM 15807 TaxID=1123380 RepID=A0A1M5T694_9BACT|nr:tetratricopeptide repeat protein [Thermosipho atlanticus]SHH46120.1 Tfp pilus assembly protein PilF [Thermosipho atlanticus DSM 15807]